MRSSTKKFDFDEDEIMTTDIDTPDDFIKVNDEFEDHQDKPFNDVHTTSIENGVRIVDNSYCFAISSSQKRKKNEKKTERIKNYDVFVSKINSISEREWNESELIKYIGELAKKINLLLITEENKSDFIEVVNLSHLMSMLYKKAHEILIQINSDSSSKYALYSSFWSLKSNLSNKES